MENEVSEISGEGQDQVKSPDIPTTNPNASQSPNNNSLIRRLVHMFGHNSRYENVTTQSTNIELKTDALEKKPIQNTKPYLKTDEKLISFRNRTNYLKNP